MEEGNVTVYRLGISYTCTALKLSRCFYSEVVLFSPPMQEIPVQILLATYEIL